MNTDKAPILIIAIVCICLRQRQLRDTEQAIGQLMARGYSFRTPGRAFDVNAPVSDFYGLQWGKDQQKGAFVFFYTTRENTFKHYASR